jgi:uncharacterized repeat protein (TIGR03803 family)
MRTSTIGRWRNLTQAAGLGLLLLGAAIARADDPCIITNEADPFAIVSIMSGTNGVTIAWQSCPDHAYEVDTTEALSTNTIWTFQQSLVGGNLTTSWTDTNSASYAARFYHVVRTALMAMVSGSTTINAGQSATIEAALTGTPPWIITWSDGLITTNYTSPAIRLVDPCSTTIYTITSISDGSSSNGVAGGSATVYVNPMPASIALPSVVYVGSTGDIASVNALTMLHSFTGSDGPAMGLIRGTGTDSNFYGIANVNTLFMMSPDGTVTQLFKFAGGPLGSNPSLPVRGADSNFYGGCFYGGMTNAPNNCQPFYGFGTVYKLTPQGTLSALHVFSGSPEGSAPVGRLLQGADGAFYGVTEYGGTNACPGGNCCTIYGYGTVFRITLDGTLTTLYSFTNGVDGAYPHAPLVQGSDGYLYGTTYLTTINAGTVFKINTNGTGFTSLYAFTGGADGAFPAASLSQNGDGNFYGTATQGGTNGMGTVFMITTNGALTTLHQFTGNPDGYRPSSALVTGADGNFYGTTVWGGSTNTLANVGGQPPGRGIVYRITPQGTLTTAYVFTGGADGGSPNGLTLGWFDNYLYGATINGGPTGFGILYKVLPATYQWSITGGTNTSSQGSQTMEFTANSACPVTLNVVVSGEFGCTITNSATTTPTAPPPSVNSPANPGDTLNLSVPTVAGATYSWTGPNGFSSTNQNPSISNAQLCNSGRYWVSVTASGCTSLSNSVSVTVNPPEPTSNSPICEGNALYLSVTNVPGATYSWTGPSGFTSTNENPFISGATTNASGVYCLTVTANGCVWTQNCVAATVKVNPLPTAFVSGTTTTGPQCGVTIQAFLTGSAPWTVTWSDGFIQSNVTVNPAQRIVNPPSTTNYTVTALSDANCSGDSLSGSATVTVTTNLTTSVNVSNEVLVVYNSNTNFPDSLSCKNYYINNRPGFSNANVLACSCTTTGTDSFESISTANLTNQIINPIINFIQSNPAKSIHYIVLMYGMPSRITDGVRCGGGPPASVQFVISHSLSTNVCAPSGAVYEGSSCPFFATNYPGTTCLVTALNMETLTDCEAYIDKVASMYRSNVIISAEAAGYTNTNYYLDDVVEAGRFPYLYQFQTAISNQNPNASIVYSSNAVIRTGSDVRGYASWGVHDGVFSSMYPTNGAVVWSGNSKWWIIETIESFNGQRDASLGPGGQQAQGDVEEWFAPNAWGGTNYSNTPVGAVSHVEEPGFAINGPTYMSLWEEGFLFSECAWASKIGSNPFQVIGDPLIRK